MSGQWRRTARATFLSGLCLLAIAFACIWTIDAPVARAARAPVLVAATQRFTTAVETAFLFPLSIYATGALLLALALAVSPFARVRGARPVLLFVGVSQVTTRFLVDILKPVFDRLRPWEALDNGVLTDRFFTATGNSFPSGHAAHFWGLFFAMAMVFPRYSLPLLLLPVAASIARVAVNDHYVSDVIASAGVAALVTVASARLFRRAFERRAEPAAKPGKQGGIAVS
jgi:membrane-associated phospholipid phosphatase